MDQTRKQEILNTPTFFYVESGGFFLRSAGSVDSAICVQLDCPSTDQTSLRSILVADGFEEIKYEDILETKCQVEYFKNSRYHGFL